MLTSFVLLASAIIPVSADTTSDYSESVTYTNASIAKMTLVSNVSSTYVYVHYMVNNGQDMHYLMRECRRRA
ncbi:hypothetical protein [Cohnella phaseoli]|uniref:Uncharacterized protein n=1 Tax=Cohnella phaseoli TaxID=456490 RepID=A0A3D9KHK7_9BACL|nr:hypothetical protein [Cohnella phaseoli]RED84997.1 hypothetical protein DFP98_1051 [Cohnella phaseoli]